MSLLQTKLEELQKKEHELELIRKKILRGEVAGNGTPILVQQLQSEISRLTSQINYIRGKK